MLKAKKYVNRPKITLQKNLNQIDLKIKTFGAEVVEH